MSGGPIPDIFAPVAIARLGIPTRRGVSSILSPLLLDCQGHVNFVRLVVCGRSIVRCFKISGEEGDL